MLRGESSGRPDDNIESLKKRYVSNRILNAFTLVIHLVLMKCCLWIVFNSFPFLGDLLISLWRFIMLPIKHINLFLFSHLYKRFQVGARCLQPILMLSQNSHNTGPCQKTKKMIGQKTQWSLDRNNANRSNIVVQSINELAVSGHLFDQLWLACVQTSPLPQEKSGDDNRRR